MKVLELSWLCHNGYGEYAVLATEHYITAMENGDIDPDKTLFIEVFRALNQSPSPVENAEFKTVCELLAEFMYDYLFDADDFEDYGEYPVGVTSDGARWASSKFPEWAVLRLLADELAFYESEYQSWLKDVDEGHDFDQSDFIDFDDVNSIL